MSNVTVSEKNQNDVITLAKSLQVSKETKKLDYKILIDFALNPANKGLLNKNFSMFYEYSPLNSLLFSMQQLSRFGKVLPCANFKSWQNKGYKIKKGEKALMGWFPCGGYYITSKDDNGKEQKSYIANRFIFKPIAFSMASTTCDKIDIKTIDASGFNYVNVIKKLNIDIIDFDAHVGSNGNAGGYAFPNKNQIAINPLFDNGNSENVHTLFHELAHVLLHNDNSIKAIKDLAKNNIELRAIKELEAEMTAYLIMNTISTKYNTDYSIGYIKNWLSVNPQGFSDISCKRVLSTVNKIVKIIKELKN